LPTSSFPIAAFAEAWEYEDDEDMFGVEDGDGDGFGVGTVGRGGREKEGKTKTRTKTVGVLEKRANVTVVGGEVVIGKEAQGAVKVSSVDVLWFGRQINSVDSLICSCRIRTALTTLRRPRATRAPPKPPRSHQRRRRLLSTQSLTSDQSFRRKNRKLTWIFDIEY
jgi:hypothetical protein